MSSEIRKVIADALQDAGHDGQRIRFSDGYADAMTDAAIDALHAAGYEIVPGWSDDLSDAPRDGTRILLLATTPQVRKPHIVEGWWVSKNEYWDTAEQSGPANPTHWRPRPKGPNHA